MLSLALNTAKSAVESGAVLKNNVMPAVAITSATYTLNQPVVDYSSPAVFMPLIASGMAIAFISMQMYYLYKNNQK